MSEEKYSVEGLRLQIANIGTNLQPVKAEIQAQQKAIDEWEKIIKDIKSGVRTGKVYSVEGLENGIVQARLHIEKLTAFRVAERERSKAMQRMIADIEQAEEMSEPKVFIEFDSLKEAASAQRPKEEPAFDTTDAEFTAVDDNDQGEVLK